MKKYLVDSPESTASASDFEQLKTASLEFVDFGRPLGFLKRLGDLLAQVFNKLDKNNELLEKLI
jgi:hypothetical protein